MHVKSTTISKYLGKEKAGTERVVTSVSSRRPNQRAIVSWVLFGRGLILQVSPASAELVSGEGWCLLWVQLVVLNYRAASLLRRKSSLRISVSRNC